MIRGCQLLLAILQELLKTLYALVAGDKLALCNGNLLLEAGVLLDKLPLDNSKLFEVALQEHHLLLLGAVVG